MGLLIKNGEIITVADRYTADIYCADETITAIGRDLRAGPDDRVVDASGKLVFPGAIDPHVHLELPFMGTVSKDDFETGTIAALSGGTTCVIDFCIPDRDQSPLAALDHWHAKAAGKAAHDYTFHLAVTRFDAEAEAEIRQIVAMHGISSFKVFLAYRGATELPDDELYAMLRLASELGVLTCVHAENATMVWCEQRRLLREGLTAPVWHGRSRPPMVEAEGVRHVTNMAAFHDAPLYIVHTTCEPALDAARAARSRGQTVFIETCPQYLLLDESYCDTDGFEGAKYVLSPPLRDASHQGALWASLMSGEIATLGTDHCSFDYAAQKVMGEGDFTMIPNGLPGLEDRVTLLWSYGVGGGFISPHQFVGLVSTNAAKLFGLYPRKGTIQLGADADLVIFDPDVEGVISASTHHMNVDYNPYEGFHYRGHAETVTVRGRVVWEEGAFTGEPGYGRFLKRSPREAYQL